MWAQCLRVLKPGGHLLAFSGTRTYHRMVVAIEDAGFEIRDMIEWVYGSGFPKSLNIGKAVDKLQGNEREYVKTIKKLAMSGDDINSNEGWSRPSHRNPDGTAKRTMDITKGTSEWEGWGTALKPAHEPICMARKPLAEKTVAENVLKYGIGGVNIDKSRVGTEDLSKQWDRGLNQDETFGNGKRASYGKTSIGRFPANLIHDNSEEVRECFPNTKSGMMKQHIDGGKYNVYGKMYPRDVETIGDSGNASRFFKSIIYQAKASKSERNKGCEELEDKDRIDYGGFHSEKGLIENNRNPENRLPMKNNHPTVKPIALMEYLIKMVSRKGATILDPFAGSGTTGVACKNLNRDFILIEKEPEYIEIIKKRLL